MPRLFVALDFPEDVAQSLVAIQPAPHPGVRLIPRKQMHLTLHFLGEMALEPVLAALRSVEVSAFELTLEGVGKFRAAEGGTILWVGVRNCDALVRLHDLVGTALTTTGFRPETRPYSPHLTLARCQHNVPSSLVHDWLHEHRDFCRASIPIQQITVYSSVLQPDGPVYHIEQLVPLSLSPGS